MLRLSLSSWVLPPRFKRPSDSMCFRLLSFIVQSRQLRIRLRSLLLPSAKSAIIFPVPSVSSKRLITSSSALSRLNKLLSFFGSCCPCVFLLTFSSSCSCWSRTGSWFFELAASFFSALFFLFLWFPPPRIMFMTCTAHPSPTRELLSSSLHRSTRPSQVMYTSLLLDFHVVS